MKKQLEVTEFILFPVLYHQCKFIPKRIEWLEMGITMIDR